MIVTVRILRDMVYLTHRTLELTDFDGRNIKVLGREAAVMVTGDSHYVGFSLDTEKNTATLSI